MEVKLDSGGEIQTEGVVLDEEMRHRNDASALTQQVMQAKTQGCPAMHRVTLRPELFGEGLAQMDAAFHRQVDEEREFLARGEQQRLIGMAHFRRTQQGEGYSAHLTVLITLCYHVRREGMYGSN